MRPRFRLAAMPFALAEIAAEEEPKCMPEGTTCCALGFAAEQPRMVRGYPRVLAIVVSPDHVGRNGEALEIFGRQLVLAPSRRQIGERVTPQPTLERDAVSLFSIGSGHLAPRYAEERTVSRPERCPARFATPGRTKTFSFLLAHTARRLAHDLAKAA